MAASRAFPAVRAFFAVAILVLQAGCLAPSADDCPSRSAVRAYFQFEEKAGIRPPEPEGIKITLHRFEGSTYKWSTEQTVSPNGCANFDVEPGTYDMRASADWGCDRWSASLQRAVVDESPLYWNATMHWRDGCTPIPVG